MTTITALPTPPTRDDPTTFSARADTFLAALPTFATETNSVAGEVNTNASTATTQAGVATTQATLATAAANSAIAAANATQWVSGTTYSIGNVVWSPIDYQTYRRKIAGAGATDPSSDSTNWVHVSLFKIPTVVVITSTSTWTCPTNITKAKVYVTGGGGSAGNGVSQCGGGGGGGGTAITYLTVTPGTVYTATIGAGGTAIASGAGNTTGNTGGTSSFAGTGITTISASGGIGGASLGSGGNGGGTFAGHDIGMYGGNGHASTVNNNTPQPLGGSSFWAGASPQGAAGRGWGNGGGGLYNNIGGPAGASGVVVIEY